MKRLVALVAVASVLALATGGASAATKQWNVSSGNWNVSGNWSPTGIPVAGDEVKNCKAGGKCTVPSGYSTANMLRVYIYNVTDPTITVNGTLNVTGSAQFVKVGFGSTADQDGVMIQNGNVTLTNGSDLIIADGYTSRRAGVDGKYYLNSGTLTCDEVRLGDRAAQGFYYQSGGAANVGQVTIGIDTANDCPFELNGGSLTCTGMAVTRGSLKVSQTATCDINGNMSVSANGHLQVEISNSDNSYLDVSGNVTLSSGSTLEITLLGGYTPANGTEFTLIECTGAGTISGNFSNVPSGWTSELRDDNKRLVAKYSPAAETLKAFPGAYGFGAMATGGRGGTVYKVTNTNNSGAGSFRDATTGGNSRTVIFDTGGTCNAGTRIDTTRSGMTIAGQTAPGGGFCLRNAQFMIKNTSNWIVRHVRFRLGDNSGTHAGSEPWFDAFNLWYANDVIADHCSMSWGCDEICDVRTTSNNVTLQWCILNEGLDWYGHGYAIIFEPNGIALARATMHHNLMAHNRTRMPRVANEVSGDDLTFDFRYNVGYNWGEDHCGYGAWNSGESFDMNYVGNYIIAGPDTTSGASTAFDVAYSDGAIYQSGNKIDSDRDSSHDGTNTGWSMFAGPETQLGSPVSIPSDYQVPSDDCDTAYTNVLSGAGATKPSRDSVDTRIVNSVTNRNGSIINSQDDVGGWPSLAAGSAPTDTDGDGMPDSWETSYGTNPNVADNNGDLDSDGYTNLEEYINSL